MYAPPALGTCVVRFCIYKIERVVEEADEMTFRQMMAFAAVARHMNITKAAKELRASQPGLSKQIKGIQDDYNVNLFRRSGKRIELTEEGLELLSYIQPILEQLEKIEQRFSKTYKKPKSAELVVGGTYEVSSTLLPSLIARFKKQHPKVEVSLRSNSIAVLEQMLLKGDVELALSSISPRSPELSGEPCAPLNLVAFAAKKFPIGKRELTPVDLETIPLIVRDNRDSRGPIETFLVNLRKHGHRPNIVMRCETPEAIKAAVSELLGVGIVYDGLVKDDLARGLFKALTIQGFSAEGNMYILCHRQRPLSACAAIFIKLLRNFCSVKRNKRQSGRSGLAS
jgi:DNA-binding transcriptional LysR family regulator